MLRAFVRTYSSHRQKETPLYSKKNSCRRNLYVEGSTASNINKSLLIVVTPFSPIIFNFGGVNISDLLKFRLIIINVAFLISIHIGYPTWVFCLLPTFEVRLIEVVFLRNMI